MQPLAEKTDGPRTGKGWSPETDADRAAVRAQLERILASAAFRNSKRCPKFLEFAVQRTLEGRAESLKERTIGVEVFGREPDYDTNADHVVRTTASEIRKRLAQYYHEPGREAEIRMELPAGSYVPQFRPASERMIEAREIPAEPVTRRSLAGLVAALLVCAVLAAVFLLRRPAPRQDVLSRFWAPILSASRPVLLCVGTPQPATEAPDPAGPYSIGEFHRLPSQRVALSDAITLARIAGLLQQRNHSYRISQQAATTFADLQSGPAVLIGANNNEWTLRLIHHLRFAPEQAPGSSLCMIRDRRNPSQKSWVADFAVPDRDFTRDYALVSRWLDPKTDQPVVVAAGLTRWGTVAAGEFVTGAAHLEKLEAQAPADWERRNLQVVLSTEVINGSSGPPVIVAVHFW